MPLTERLICEVTSSDLFRWVAMGLSVPPGQPEATARRHRDDRHIGARRHDVAPSCFRADWYLPMSWATKWRPFPMSTDKPGECSQTTSRQNDRRHSQRQEIRSCSKCFATLAPSWVHPSRGVAVRRVGAYRPHRLRRLGEQPVGGLVRHAVEVAVEHCTERRVVGVGPEEQCHRGTELHSIDRAEDIGGRNSC